MTPQTPFVTLSASKPVTAMLVHLLAERGMLHLDDHVCEYIPEFGRHGKHGITIRHLLAHRAGIPRVQPGMMTLDRLSDPASVRAAVYDMVPSSTAGRVLAYHAVTAGFVLGEVVEQVSGLNARAALDEMVCRPMGFRWTNFGVAPVDVDQVARNCFTGLPVSSAVSSLFRRIIGFDFPELARVSNDSRFLCGIVPSGNVVSTANEMSRFYQLLLNGGSLDGVRIFEPQTVRRATAEQSYAEIDRSLFLPLRYSLGFMLGRKWVSLYGPRTEHAFGHLGFTNIITWADPERQVSAALMTSGKPFLHPGVYHLLELPRRIGMACEPLA